MRKRAFIVVLTVLVALPVAGFGAQRLGRRLQRGFGGDATTPAQIWRVTTLTLEQRKQLHEIQMEAFQKLRDARGGGGNRREMLQTVREIQQKMERIATPAQLAEARQKPRGPLTPEELVYYPITSLSNVDPARRAKIDAVFLPAIETARREMGDDFGRGRYRGQDPAVRQQNEAAQGEQRQRRLALFEVLDALLTTDQMIAVKQFLPEQLRYAGLRERVIYRLPTLTLEQEAQARAIYAALEDETGADRARLKAINNELRGKDSDVAKSDRQALVRERQQLQDRIDAREQQAYTDLGKVLTADQMKELAAQRPGPPRPLVFTPENIRSLSNLTPDQERRLRDALREFQRDTADERREVRDLRGEAKDADIQSMEMAGVRDQLRQAAQVIDAGRDKIVRTVADTLTGPQLAQLVAMSTAKKRNVE